MTDNLREKEQSHEARFKLDQELSFKAHCRRNKLLGLWAAERLSMTGAEADAYAKSLVRLGLDQTGIDSVVLKVTADFEEKSVRLTKVEVATAAAQFYATAVEQFSKEFPTALDRDHVRVGD